MNFSEKARFLRSNSTRPEDRFWDLVRNRKMGYKVVRQKPIIFDNIGRRHAFFADFYCHEKRLIIEIDGKIHEKQKEYDEFRDYLVRNLGYHVLRIKNEDILPSPDLELRIKRLLELSPSPRVERGPGPLPRVLRSAAPCHPGKWSEAVLLALSLLLLASCASRTVELNRAKGVRGPNAPLVMQSGVKFSVAAPDASFVNIAGSFNGWNQKSTEMKKRADGVWEITLPLTPGVKYLYKFVIEGFWVADPDNPDTTPDGMNGVNSVIEIPAAK